MSDSYLNLDNHDSRDPNPWLALYLDNSMPINPKTKLALMRDNNSKSVRYILLIVSFSSKVTIFLMHIFKFFFPKLINFSRFLHRILSWRLRHFVNSDVNLLIFRHFHVGSEVLTFIAKNVKELDLETSPIKPRNFEDVKDDIFLKHDLNLYNFVINVNQQLNAKNIPLRGKDVLDMSMITEDQFDHIDFPNKWTNILDLRSAIELFTPFYQFFLTANDFVRASNLLQLDETIAIYSSKILNSPAHLGLVNNRHPMVPDTTYSAAFRLVLHGLAAETLHAILVNIKLKKNYDGVIITK